MKRWSIAALALAAVALTTTLPVEAKRLGGGRPAGMQRSMPERTAPTAPPAKPAQAAPQQAAPAAPVAPPATPPKRNWMGPLAGLAAGLGIGALLSHFGMGGMGGGGGILSTLILLAGIGLLVMFLLRRFGPKAGMTPGMTGSGPAMAGATSGGPMWSQPAPVEVLQPVERSLPPPMPASSAPTPLLGNDGGGTLVPAAGSAITRAFVPANFDSEGFTRTAKLIFIRLQAANDAADLDDLRRFTTPELFASIRLDLQERNGQPQQTDVLKVDAEVLDVANEADRQIVSVRFHGQVVEEKGATPVSFNEVWHLVKGHDEQAPWAIAGIEPLN